MACVICVWMSPSFPFYFYRAPRDLPSFPTRRSSDLEAVGGLRIVGITIGVVLLGEAARLLLTLVGRRRLGYAEDLVIVSLRSHLRPVPAPPPLISLPLQHDYPRRPDECVAHPISGLQHRPHRVILRRIIGRSRRDRLVHMGIERHSHLIHPRDARRLERLPHLPFHHVHTVVDRLGVGLCRIDVREARQIVECIHQALYQIGLRPLPQIRAFFDRALLEIVVLGGEPEVLVLHVRELSLETDDRLLRRFDQRPGFRARRLLRGGGLRLLWFVVHGLALHEQSVCRPRCAVLAGLVGVRVGSRPPARRAAPTGSRATHRASSGRAPTDPPRRRRSPPGRD